MPVRLIKINIINYSYTNYRITLERKDTVEMLMYSVMDVLTTLLLIDKQPPNTKQPSQADSTGFVTSG